MSSCVGIIGGGLTGLTAAYRLVKKGVSVTVFEQAAEPGGLAASMDLGTVSLERFYHHIFTSDKYLLDLCRELGLDSLVGWFEPRNAIFIDNRLYPFTSPMDLLRFTPMSLASRIRTGLLTLASRFVRDYKPFESQTAKDWLIKRAGEQSYRKVWEPLLASKFDRDADLVSAVWIWNKFKLRGASRGRNINREKLGYMKGGFAQLISKLSEEITEAGGIIRLNCPISGIRCLPDGGFSLDGCPDGEKFDRALFTGSPQQLAALDTPLDAGQRRMMSELKAKANLCLNLELDRPLSDYYWITVAQRDIPFVLIIEHTNLVGMDNYPSHVVYLSRYVDQQDAIWQKSDHEIEAIFLDGLSRVFPGFDRAWIKRSTLSRAPYAQPVITRHYSRLVPSIKTAVDGLYLASMAQIYPEDRGMNYAVRLGTTVADEILREL
ncbi:NAD(P)/FAD-dependent oxidoreductase [Thermoclostridium caenicola]|uniref:Protoporphyrinogen oxidase n=1 Tax=Thermoclostridium caenicola TaxID=659425 RepID=A0A1M6GXZ3_9FIRM|nr:NAD(P)/FAD-dependent oxidoreductase [Thermoclostridium caenicola]SHJ14735.1 Protoporphyrinogen oxidase [Thermoclostridium caenicola]